MIRDMREVGPVESGDKVYRAWEPCRPVFRCSQHARTPRKRYLDGRVVEQASVGMSN